MKDRFKFRIFNKLAMEFSYFSNPDLQVCFNGDFKSGLIFPMDNSAIYMGKYEEIQFCTGLKDKNGELIYEGDIISRGEDRGVIKYDDETASYYIRWKESETFIEDCEVIGNIYENPELLEVNNE